MKQITEDEKLKNIIDALLTRICHDLINPIGSIQMAFESNEPKYLEASIKEAIEKIDMYRFLYKESTENDVQIQKLNTLIDQNNLNIKINFQHKKLSSLIFFLSQKLLKNSSIIVNENEIILDYFFFNQKEIDGINGIFNHNELIPSNIILYLANIQYKKYYTTSIINKENNSWTIQIKNI